MVARKAAEREPQRDITEPIHSPDREGPQTTKDAAEVVRGVFGDAIAWERTFRNMKDHDGNPIYVNERTGQVYAELPELAKDGRDA